MQIDTYLHPKIKLCYQCVYIDRLEMSEHMYTTTIWSKRNNASEWMWENQANTRRIMKWFRKDICRVKSTCHRTIVNKRCSMHTWYVPACRMFDTIELISNRSFKVLIDWSHETSCVSIALSLSFFEHLWWIVSIKPWCLSKWLLIVVDT